MAAKGNSYSSSMLSLIFNATTFTSLAENASSSPLTALYVSLHTSSPGASGTQQTSEAAYGNYSRVSVARTGAGFTVSGSSVTPVSAITFPLASSGSETETYFGIGTAASGAGELLYFGPISPNVPVTGGVQPILGTSSTVTES